MSAFFRKRIEATIEHLIGVLDEMDGDPDLEPDPVEEQHDREQLPPTKPKAPQSFVLAELRRRHRSTRH